MTARSHQPRMASLVSRYALMSGSRTGTHCSSMSSFMPSETMLGSVVRRSTSSPKFVGDDTLKEWKKNGEVRRRLQSRRPAHGPQKRRTFGTGHSCPS
jgi:hypothetical protein